MLQYLLDTDILCKRSGPNGANIRRWLMGIDDNALAISVISLFEISRGVQKKRDAGAQALVERLEAGFHALKAGFSDRILAVDPVVAERWGRLAGSERGQWMDRGLVATALNHGLVLVTCNAKDVKGRGVEVINPDRNRPARWGGDGTPI